MTRLAAIQLPDHSFPNVRAMLQPVSLGDEKRLLPDEEHSFSLCAQSVKRQGGAARAAARSLLESAGHFDWPLLRNFGRGPTWPPGVKGSLAHCDEWAIAAVTTAQSYLGLGVDIEPVRPLPHDLFQLVATQTERQFVAPDTVRAMILFCAKEATYKAVHPLDGRFLEMPDIEVDLTSATAKTSYGRQVNLFVHVDQAVVVFGALRR